MSERELADRAMQRELNRIKTEIEKAAQALSRTPDNHPNRVVLLDRLGRAHGNRFDLRGDLQDIDKAIEYTTIIPTLISDSNSGRPQMLANLGMLHIKRFRSRGNVDDSTKAIEYGTRALALLPDGDPDLPGMLSNLGGFHGDRFRELGELKDLEKGIKYESCAVKLTSNEDPDLSRQLVNLGVSYTHRFERLGELSDLGKAIKYQTRAITLPPNTHPDLPGQLANLGASHSHRFQRLGELGDLEKAIEYGSRSVASTPDSHPDLSRRLANLGVSLQDRFKRLNELDDLDKAIQSEFRALSVTPDDHPDMPRRLGNLAGSHFYRFQRLGELQDLEAAMEYVSRALPMIPDSHPEVSVYLTNLGAFHSARFQRLGETVDLEKAVEYESRALSITPNSHPDMSLLLANLGSSLRDRTRHLGDLGDLDKAIEYGSRALLMIPDDHSALPDRLHDLGISHGDRFRHLGLLHDLEKAIEYTSRALALTPDDHPRLPYTHHALATYRYQKYHCTDNPYDLLDSLDSFQQAAQSPSGSARDKFSYAIQWAKHVSEETSMGGIEAYQTAMDLLPQFIWLGATTNQRYQDLLETESLAVNAAANAIVFSEYKLALEWLESARCVVWNQTLLLRSPLDQLHTSHPELATRLQNIATRLHGASLESRESREFQALTSSRTVEDVAQEHRRLAKEYDDLISQARSLPGFEDFLRPTKASSLVHAARNGPIVTINCHESHCDALVLLPQQDSVAHIPLPSYNAEKAKRACSELSISLRSKGIRERGVKVRREPGQQDKFRTMLRDLWNDVIKPILEFLGYMDTSSTESLPHITWCPTGALSFLPLHAAGDYDQPRSRVFDYAISSYTPTLTALLANTPSSINRDSSLLATGLQSTPGHAPLLGTAREIACVRGHAKNVVKYSQLTNGQAKVAVVLNAMEKHDWVHLACHAHQNVEDPTKSGFFMHDGTLDLASINRRSFKNKGLAFLSACQTATGDEKLPDEAIHLASGMLMAGYSSVIATMWSVVDQDAPFVADKVYGQLMKDGTLGNGEAGKALHYAVAELRERVGEKEFGRWVPYIHIGS